jgi:hypothetical protein
MKPRPAQTASLPKRVVEHLEYKDRLKTAAAVAAPVRSVGVVSLLSGV